MNKSELVAVMAKKSNLSKKDCEVAWEVFSTAIRAALQSGDKVHLVGFDTFEVKERVA